jgi:precorrin-8X/cobalt-precorrin-8 methylmutase
LTKGKLSLLSWVKRSDRIQVISGEVMDANYTDIGATTAEAMDISMKSRRLISEMIGDTCQEDRIRQRCAIATGDPGIAEIMRFRLDPVNAGMKALEQGSAICTDIKMVEAGIVKKGHMSPVKTLLGHGDEIASDRGITRTSAGVLFCREELSDSIVIIGNAPSALMTLCELMVSGIVQPSLVIGVPVGFVNAEASRERLRNIEVPSISTTGTRGGTPIAVAAMNEIINIHVRDHI